MKIDQIAQIAIPVRDVARATAFYRDTLGMRFLFNAPPGLAFFDCGGVRLMLSKPEEAEFDHESSILYYRVEEIMSAADALRARGVTAESEPHAIAKMPTHAIWMAFFRDSEHNLFALTSEVPN